MRHFFIECAALLLLFAACSTTETVQDEEPEQAEPEPIPSATPSWYTEGIHSSSDSLNVYGYSLASATDSSTAVNLSTRNSLEYLRFEIDRTAEQARKELVNSNQNSGRYSSSSFIIELRNIVSGLSLDSATFTRTHYASAEGIHYSYTRSGLSRASLSNLFKNHIEDDRFPEQLRASFP